MKFVLLGLIIFLCVAFTSCNPISIEADSTTTNISATQADDFDPPIFTPPNDIVQIEENDIEAPLPYERQYRYNYYRLDSIYYGTVDYNELIQFSEKHLESIPFEVEISEMTLFTFIKYFDIQKDKFEKAVVQDWQQKKEWGFDMAQEGNELPNPDILYTFDNEIINAYYRRENPVAPDWLTDDTVHKPVYESYSAYLEANPQ